MRRLVWLTLGAVLGAWAILRAQRFARHYGPGGMAQRAVRFGAAMRAFAAEARTEMNRREAELRRAFDGTPLVGQVGGPPRAIHDNAIHDNAIHDIDKDGH
jgi:hypothetical protein